MASGGSRANSGPKTVGDSGKNHHPFVGIRKYEEFMASHAERLTEYGITVPKLTEFATPLDCLLVLMKIALNDALQTPGMSEWHQFAMECARHAAPYVHPRLSMALVSHHSLEARPETLSDDDLEKLIREAGQVLTERSAIPALVSPDD